ncbi:hypothetical protein PPERSA_07278 [Pseudocohnilembus persalinus]|uniref:RNase NYN domain-containing protein n=1 Tax=Pseudocohnilembus persalinus TaxID=266149 RepID=A0A0V0QCY6_PSEPJ|nr:hypothetical protein PPERSA_07278 [Pseudocohnilembus persalinus]|eukprot:KRX00081.1 hypothetical protein PPERSA_07278 [Pseudocohnilembus persalinus]
MQDKRPEKNRPYHGNNYNKQNKYQNNDKKKDPPIQEYKKNDILLETESKLENMKEKEQYSYFKYLEKKVAYYFRKIEPILHQELLEARAHLLKVGKNLFQNHLDFTSGKKLEVRIWEIFKKELEARAKFQEQIKQNQNNSNSNSNLTQNQKNQINLEADHLSYDYKIQYIKEIRNLAKEKEKDIQSYEITIDSNERRLVANLNCYYGELIELKEKVSKTNKKKSEEAKKFAANQYFKSINYYPFNGKYYIHLGNLTLKNNDILQSLYWCIRGFCCENSFECKEGIKRFLEENQKNLYEFTLLKQKMTKEQFDVEMLKKDFTYNTFLLYYFRFFEIIFNHSGIKKISSQIELFKYLHAYIQAIRKNDNNEINHQKEGTMLSYIVILCIFLLFYTIEGFSADQKFDEKKLKKTIHQMESDDFMKATLKFCFGIISSIIEISITIDDEIYINAVLPFFYYFSIYKNQSKFFFENFKAFQKLINKYNQIIRKRLQIKIQENQNLLQLEQNEQIQEQEQKNENLSQNQEQQPNQQNLNQDNILEQKFRNYALNYEQNLLGFIPLKLFFQQNKEKFQTEKDQTLNYILKLFAIQKIIPSLRGFQIIQQVNSHSNNNKNTDSIKEDQENDELDDFDFNDDNDANSENSNSDFGFEDEENTEITGGIAQQFLWDSEQKIKQREEEEKLQDIKQLTKDIKKELEDQFKDLPQQNDENLSKTLIIVDGMNVAIRHGKDKRFSSQGLKAVVDFFLPKKHNVLILLPDFCFNKEQALKKTTEYEFVNASMKLKYIPDDVDLLNKLKEKGYATGIPNWNNDDSFIIEYARSKQGYILTNDRFNDHINYYEFDSKKREKLKDFIRNSTISYTFIKDELVPDPDFLKSKNIR